MVRTVGLPPGLQPSAQVNPYQAADIPSAGALYPVGGAIRRVCCSGLRGLVAYSALKRGPYPLEYYQLGERNVTDVGDEGL